MLHRISIANYQSIQDEIIFDFRVPLTTPEGDWLRAPSSWPKLRVPTVIALIGPNGSGKTACLRALADTIRFAVDSYGYDAGTIKLLFPAFASEAALCEPTRVTVDFDAPWLLSGANEPHRLFRYTLELRRTEGSLCPHAVAYEALHDFRQGRPRRIMERRNGERVYVAKEISIKPRDERLAYMPENASALSTLSRMGVDEFSELVEGVRQIQTNVPAIDPVRLPTDLVVNQLHENPQTRSRLADKLRRFDLGIEAIEISHAEDGARYLAFAHSGLDGKIPFLSESAGTRHIVQTYPSLDFVLETGGLAIMDALDNDLHAELVDEILGWFRRRDTNPHNAQLICSLHSISALDQLEKEEVFIVEKDRAGVTSAHGVRYVEGVRRSYNIQKLYRGGALGGLPAFG